MMINEFSYPQRMSPAALVIIYAKLFKRCLAPLSFPALYSLFTSTSENRGFIILLVLSTCLFFPFILALISYFPKKFYIKDGNLIFMHGLVNKENTIVPLDRIHALRTEKGIWFRILGMHGIIFDTIATRQEEIELILDEYEWQRLLRVIEKEERQPITENDPSESNQDTIVHYPTKDLLLAALCQNHLKGMAVLISLAAIMFGNLGELPEEQSLTVFEWLVAFFDTLVDSPLKIVVFSALIYLVILIMWLGKTFLRYYDTTMIYNPQLLTFSYGLLTRSGCRFFHNKICTIWIKRNFLEKKFGFCTLMLRQALNATARKEDDNLTLYGTDNSSFFLKWWLGEDYAAEEDIITAKSGKGVFIRHVSIRSVLALAVSILLYDSQLYILMLLPILYIIIILIPRGICAMNNSRISLKSDYFIIKNGAFAEINNYIKYCDIEVVRICRSPFTHWFHRVSLAISTSGTTFIIRSLQEKEATLIRELLLK